jgi:hypothetical protein
MRLETTRQQFLTALLAAIRELPAEIVREEIAATGNTMHALADLQGRHERT